MNKIDIRYFCNGHPTAKGVCKYFEPDDLQQGYCVYNRDCNCTNKEAQEEAIKEEYELTNKGE